MITIPESNRRPDITFYPAGKIDISSRVARVLGLSSGDVVSLSVDSDEELYLSVSHRAGTYDGRQEGRVRSLAGLGGTFRTYSVRMTSLVGGLSGRKGRLRCPCGEVIERGGAKYVTIIYRLAR